MYHLGLCSRKCGVFIESPKVLRVSFQKQKLTFNQRISYKKYWMLSETFLVLDWAFSHTMYQRKVDVDMQNAVKSMLADVSSVSPSSEQRELYHRLFTIEIVSFTHWWHSLLLQMRSYLSKNKHNITLDILLSYIFQLSTAMSYLESKNFCHR